MVTILFRWVAGQVMQRRLIRQWHSPKRCICSTRGCPMSHVFVVFLLRCCIFTFWPFLGDRPTQLFHPEFSLPECEIETYRPFLGCCCCFCCCCIELYGSPSIQSEPIHVYCWMMAPNAHNTIPLPRPAMHLAKYSGNKLLCMIWWQMRCFGNWWGTPSI